MWQTQKAMRLPQTDRLLQDSQTLSDCVTTILDQKKIKYRIAEVDRSHSESIWYQVDIRTRPEAGLKLVLHLLRDAIGLFCNDYSIFICLSEEPSDFSTWMRHLPLIAEAILRPEIRIRGRWSISAGKIGAIWLELPEGGRWMGDRKACHGSGKEFIFKTGINDPKQDELWNTNRQKRLAFVKARLEKATAKCTMQYEKPIRWLGEYVNALQKNESLFNATDFALIQRIATFDKKPGYRLNKGGAVAGALMFAFIWAHSHGGGNIATGVFAVFGSASALLLVAAWVKNPERLKSQDKIIGFTLGAFCGTVLNFGLLTWFPEETAYLIHVSGESTLWFMVSGTVTGLAGAMAMTAIFAGQLYQTVIAALAGALAAWSTGILVMTMDLSAALILAIKIASGAIFGAFFLSGLFSDKQTQKSDSGNIYQKIYLKYQSRVDEILNRTDEINPGKPKTSNEKRTPKPNG